MAKESGNKALKSNKTEKSFALVYIVVAIVILVVIVLLILPQSKDFDIRADNSTRIDLSSEIELMTRCLPVSNVPVEERTNDFKDCPTLVKEEDINKLKLLDGTKGSVSCDSFGKNDSGQTYRNCFYITRGCYVKFLYTKSVPGTVVKELYQVYECEDKQYYAYSHTNPDEIKYIEIHLSKEIMDSIKS